MQAHLIHRIHPDIWIRACDCGRGAVFFSVARGVVVKGNDQETLNAVKGTVLERFKEDRNLLNMMGITNSSDQ